VMSHLVIILVHIFIVDIVILTFWSVGSDASDNRLLDFAPFASNVTGFVVVASACSSSSWEWSHLEHFSVVLVSPVVASKVVLDLSWVWS